MDLRQILKQPEGFTPPEVTVKIDKIYEYKHGTSEKGPWSFQDVQVVGGGRLKLKGINHELPKDREGMTVTIRAHSSPQHGLTGMKVAHEEYNGSVYDKLIITKSARWEWANPKESSNGNGHKELSYEHSDNSEHDEVKPYMAHLFGCASLAGQVAGLMKVSDEQALQACFATICIDTKNRGILLPAPNGEPDEQPEPEEDDTEDAPF